MVRPWVWLVIAGLIAASIGSLWVAASRSREVAREKEERGSLERQLTALRQQMKELERKSQEPAARETSAPPPPPAEASPDLANLRREAETLRSQVARLQLENQNLRQARTPERQPTDAAALQVKAKDATAAVGDRIEALMKLRIVPGGRSPDVVVSMLDLLESGIDTAYRADILRHLKGAVGPAEAPRVMTLLRSDKERVVREEAAETLGPLRDDANVRAALEEASKNDASEEVRREAKEALDGVRRRRD